MPLTIIVAMSAGVLIAAYSGSVKESTLDLYDKIFPVVRYQSEIVSREDNAVSIHVWGEKLRNCQAVPGSLQSYTLRDEVRFDADEQRVLCYESSRPVGKVDLGIWRVWPVKGARAVEMYVLHDCDGHLVRSKLVDVKL